MDRDELRKEFLKEMDSGGKSTTEWYNSHILWLEDKVLELTNNIWSDKKDKKIKELEDYIKKNDVKSKIKKLDGIQNSETVEKLQEFLEDKHK